MTTTRQILSTLALLILATDCAEPGAIGSNVGKAGSGSSVGGSTGKGGSGSTSGGRTTTTTSSNGGSTTTASGGVTAKGGATGTTATGGTTTAASGGATTVAPSSCGTISGELVVVNTPRTNEIGAMTMITPATGLTIPVSEIGVKFCFSVLSTSAVTVSPTAMKIYSGGIENLTADPYYVNLGTTTVTVENAADGGYCLVVDVAGATGAATAQLTGKADIKLDWIFDTSGLGVGAMLDPTKPAQIIVTRNGAVAGCGDVTI